MNLESIEQVVAVLAEYPVSEITVEQDGRRIHARRPLVSAAAKPAAAAKAAGQANAEMPGAEMSGTEIPGAEMPQAEPVSEPSRTLTAPMVGIFHTLEPPLSFATSVRVGQVIGYIESMKLMNEVIAEDAGQVTDILAEDGAPVEYGQPLYRIAA